MGIKNGWLSGLLSAARKQKARESEDRKNFSSTCFISIPVTLSPKKLKENPACKKTSWLLRAGKRLSPVIVGAALDLRQRV